MDAPLLSLLVKKGVITPKDALGYQAEVVAAQQAEDAIQAERANIAAAMRAQAQVQAKADAQAARDALRRQEKIALALLQEEIAKKLQELAEAFPIGHPVVVEGTDEYEVIVTRSEAGSTRQLVWKPGLEPSPPLPVDERLAALEAEVSAFRGK